MRPSVQLRKKHLMLLFNRDPFDKNTLAYSSEYQIRRGTSHIMETSVPNSSEEQSRAQVRVLWVFSLKMVWIKFGKQYTEASNRIASQVPGLKMNIKINYSNLNELKSWKRVKLMSEAVLSQLLWARARADFIGNTTQRHSPVNTQRALLHLWPNLPQLHILSLFKHVLWLPHKYAYSYAGSNINYVI